MYNSGSLAGWRGTRVSRPAVYTFLKPQRVHTKVVAVQSLHTKVPCYENPAEVPLSWKFAWQIPSVPLHNSHNVWNSLIPIFPACLTALHLQYCLSQVQLTAFLFFFCCTMQLVGFLTAPHSLWDPSSLTRGRTQAPCTDGEVLTTGLPGKSLVGF